MWGVLVTGTIQEPLHHLSASHHMAKHENTLWLSAGTWELEDIDPLPFSMCIHLESAGQPAGCPEACEQQT